MIEYISICEKIFGPNIYTFKRKTLNTKPEAVVNDYIDMPQKLKDTHQNTELCSNIKYIQGKMFLVTMYKKVKFIKIQEIKDRKIPIYIYILT